jgi:hypothetical protein
MRLKPIHRHHLLAASDLENEVFWPRPDHSVWACIRRGQRRPGASPLDVNVSGLLQTTHRRLRGHLRISARLAGKRRARRSQAVPEI